MIVEVASGPIECRVVRRSGPSVLLLHGGHLRADVPVDEDTFVEAGYTVVVPSRPGYGATPLEVGETPEECADALVELCRSLDLLPLAAVIGQSAGGPTALALASRHPELVERVVLQSAVGLLPWPSRRTRLAAAVAFHPRSEGLTWSAVRALIGSSPRLALRLLLPDLTTLPVSRVLRDLSDQQRTALTGLFGAMRSGEGFRNDVSHLADPDAVRRRSEQARHLRQPALIVATREDASVPFQHAESLHAAIPNSRLLTSSAPSHLIWYGDDYPDLAAATVDFLAGRNRAGPS